MSPAAKASGKAGSKSATVRKPRRVQRKGPQRTSHHNASGEELRRLLIDLHAWEAVRGPHATGLGQLQMWVTAFSIGVLGVEEDAPSGLQGRVL